MEIERKSINAEKTVYEGIIKTSAEENIIVPDVKPDILKVIQVSAEPYLCEKQIEDGKMTLTGKVKINILYCPEGGDGALKSISGISEFCETLKKAEFKENMTVTAFCDADKVSYKLINSRKISIDAKILLSVSVMSNEAREPVSGVLSENAETKNKTVDFCRLSGYDEFEFTIDEEVELPPGKTVSELLKADTSIIAKEQKALDSKLIVKGRLGVSILYNNGDNRCESLDCELPFTEVFDIEGLSEDEEAEVVYEIGETAYELINDSGDTAGVRIKADVRVCVMTEKDESVSVMEDCYFTDSESVFSEETVKLRKTVCKPDFSAVVKQILQKAPDQPDIAGVYKVQARPYITSTDAENGKLRISGGITVYVLYITDDEQTPVAAIREDEPFNYTVDCDGDLKSSSKAELTAECEHISYTISSKDAVEVRCGIVISGRVINLADERIITDVSAEPSETRESGIAAYFVKDGDCLWDIAKRYKTKTESILLANGLSGDDALSKGEKIIIPIC